MFEKDLKALLVKFKNSKISINEVISQLKKLPFEDLEGFAKIDRHRALRKGYPEVIYCEGKSEMQILKLVERNLHHKENLLLTRAKKEIYKLIIKINPLAVYNQEGRTIVIEYQKLPKKKKTIAIITAGTSDIPVAEEAAATIDIMGNKVERLYDVGVAGLHRLIGNWNVLEKAGIIIVVAGMEGALASVVGGLIDKPIIAVPTSVGYGASFGGLASLLGMLNTCAPGVAVVNIDNGFGAGYFASVINRD